MMIFIRYGSGYGFAIIMGIVLIGVIIYTIIALRKQVSRTENSEKNPALELLKERHKQGKITDEEYRAKKKRLLDSKKK